MSFAVFTVMHDEPELVGPWLGHYARQEADWIFVLDHGSRGDGREALEAHRPANCTIVPVVHGVSFDHLWLTKLVQDFQRFLLSSYTTVLFAAADEMVVFDPERYEGTLGDFAGRMRLPVVVCQGYDILHKQAEEPPLRLGEPWLPQRHWWSPTRKYSKPLLAQMPLYWRPGFQGAHNVPQNLGPSPDLLLLHLHRIDFDLTLRRHQRNNGCVWNPADKVEGPGVFNRLEEQSRLQEWFLTSADNTAEPAKLYPIPAGVQGLTSWT